MVFFLAFFLAVVHAVTEGICDSPTFDTSESNIFWTILLNTFFFPSTAKTEGANCALILVWQCGGWVCSELKWAHELFSSLLPCWRAVGHEGRAEGFVVRSVQLHHCTNCRAGVLSSLEEYRQKRSVLWRKAQSRLRKHNFSWLLFFVVFFHYLPHELHFLCPVSVVLKYGW